MRKILISVLLMYSVSSYSQELFVMNDRNFTDFIVVDKEGESTASLYGKTLEWINRNYKNPEKVILGKIENEYIRFEGYKDPFACKRILGSYICEEGRYQIEISFKEGKYKFDVIKVETYTESSQYVSGGWTELNMNDTSFYYKNGKVRRIYESYPQSMEKVFNELNASLSSYISKPKDDKSNDW